MGFFNRLFSSDHHEQVSGPQRYASTGRRIRPVDHDPRECGPRNAYRFVPGGQNDYTPEVVSSRYKPQEFPPPPARSRSRKRSRSHAHEPTHTYGYPDTDYIQPRDRLHRNQLWEAEERERSKAIDLAYRARAHNAKWRARDARQPSWPLDWPSMSSSSHVPSSSRRPSTRRRRETDVEWEYDWPNRDSCAGLPSRSGSGRSRKGSRGYW
ncbi:hypothetical protein PMZ80_010266 [Knufia obscura]|uniref:Uncharacterized protein n=2 Tax=Knufia TaxID=430999 RepID=A0AAN8EJR2_9EURO|nr:hypothetical protein PMZ80_010266 [Knufia obscura]KAK5953003.1 hypothetical protein OHC33_006125 [Knufia fluminis]